MTKKRSIAAKKIANFNAAYKIGDELLLDGDRLVRLWGRAGYTRTWQAAVYVELVKPGPGVIQEPVELGRLKPCTL